MPNLLRVRDQQIAVLGEAGSGKTVLASSFYGATQESSHANDLWHLVADDAGQGDRLLQNYVGMRDRAKAPLPTRFEATTYSFLVRMKGGDPEAEKKWPFDALRLAWHDYPGEWFHESLSSAEEGRRRVATFRSLLGSDVALLLVDGQKLLDHRGEEERYLTLLLTNMRNGLLRLKDDLLGEQDRLVEFPRIWIMALSKADLFPDWDVQVFRDLLIEKAARQIGEFRRTIEEFVDTPGALSVGEDFLLLSSARFALSGSEPTTIDVTERVGVDLILPVASILPLERRVQWGERMEMPRKVLDTVAEGAEGVALLLGEGKRFDVVKLAARVPRVGPLASMVALPAVRAAARLAGAQLKEVNARARRRHDNLTATLSQFKLDLEQGVKDGRLIRSQK